MDLNLNSLILQWFELKKMMVIFVSLHLIGCGIHNSETNVIDNSKKNNFEQKSGEKLLQAYLKKDKNEIKKLVETEKIFIDFVLSDGTTLLFKASKNFEFSWVHFFLKLGADPQLTVLDKDSKQKISPIMFAEGLEEQNKDKIVLVAILNNQLNSISDGLLYDALFNYNLDTKTVDVEWFDLLLENDGRLSLENKDFKNLFLNILPNLVNHKAVEDRLIQYHEEMLLVWKDFLVSDFIDGKYKQGKCKFYESYKEVTYDEFLLSCAPNSRTKFNTIRDTIERYLNLWNRLVLTLVK
jgi:hypothetical protein